MATRQARRRVAKAGKPALAFVRFQCRQAALGVHFPTPEWVGKRLDRIQSALGGAAINAAVAEGAAEGEWLKARCAAYEAVYGTGPIPATGGSRTIRVEGPGF